MRRELGTLVHQAVRERALPSVSVSDVEVSRDLAHANVYVTALLPDHAQAAITWLNQAAKEFRHTLSGTMRMRSVPALHFRYDESIDRGERIDRLLQQKPPGSS